MSQHQLPDQRPVCQGTRFLAEDLAGHLTQFDMLVTSGIARDIDQQSADLYTTLQEETAALDDIDSMKNT